MAQSRRSPDCPGFIHAGPATGDDAGARPDPPHVTLRGTAVHVTDPETGAERAIEELGRVGAWTLMAVFENRGETTAVFEELGRTDGRIVFVCDDGVRLELGKSLEPTEHGDDSRWYHGHRQDEVLPAGAHTFDATRDEAAHLIVGQPDVLRYELLQGGSDPDPEEVAACFPPMRRNVWDGHERPHTFIGTPISADVIPFYYREVAMVWRVPTTIVAPGSDKAMEAENLWEGLVGGWLPVVRTVYPTGTDECWEVVAFAPAEGATAFAQPAWYRYVRLERGVAAEVKYVDSFLPYPHSGSPDPAGFYRSLFSVHDYWEQQLASAMSIRGADSWIDDFSRHAIALERITRRGDHPKYGISDHAYGGEEHDGFPDLLTNSVTCCNEWGLFSSARGYLDYYFTHFVRLDGSLNHRGPEIGKYGALLSCLAQYCDYADDDALLCEHDQKVKAIVDLLVTRWQDARRVPPSDPTYGMIKGRNEADIGFLTPTLLEMDYEQPYLSNSAQAWRGLRDIASSWQRVGGRSRDGEMVERGRALAENAAELFADARHGVESSWLEKDGVRGLPIIAGSSEFYWETTYRSGPESFDENRVWSELLWSGIPEKSTVDEILEIAGARGGSTLDIFTNRYHIVAFLVSEAVHGLLQHDLVPEALLVFYAHAFHAHTRGTWTARECVDLNRDTGYSTPYCIPAQVTIPTIAKWLLVFEDPIERTLTLGQGAARAWLKHGEGFGVERAPTRWGSLNYVVRSRLDEGAIDVDLTLPPRPGARIRVRLRCPDRYVPESVQVLNRDDVAIDVDGDLLTIQEGAVGRVKCEVLCART